METTTNGAKKTAKRSGRWISLEAWVAVSTVLDRAEQESGSPMYLDYILREYPNLVARLMERAKRGELVERDAWEVMLSYWGDLPEADAEDILCDEEQTLEEATAEILKGVELLPKCPKHVQALAHLHKGEMYELLRQLGGVAIACEVSGVDVEALVREWLAEYY